MPNRFSLSPLSFRCVEGKGGGGVNEEEDLEGSEGTWYGVSESVVELDVVFVVIRTGTEPPPARTEEDDEEEEDRFNRLSFFEASFSHFRRSPRKVCCSIAFLLTLACSSRGFMGPGYPKLDYKRRS